MAVGCLLEHFSAPEDPRRSWKVVYPLPEVLLLVPRAMLGGAEGFVTIDAMGATATIAQAVLDRGAD
jgi:hypothetical protein